MIVGHGHWEAANLAHATLHLRLSTEANEYQDIIIIWVSED